MRKPTDRYRNMQKHPENAPRRGLLKLPGLKPTKAECEKSYRRKFGESFHNE